MFPQVAPKFFSTRAEGPKNLGKDPDAKPAGADSAPGGKTPVSATVNYDVKLNGKTTRVTVSPA
jgi:methylmalonyl-CoA carboxyltransferase 5S subunit